MSAVRYSGLVESRITYVDAESRYRVYLSTPTTMARKGVYYTFPERSIPDGYPLRAVDAPETFDNVARLAFARAAWESVHSEDWNGEAWAYAWTARPTYLQVGYTTPDGDAPTRIHAGDGLVHTDIHVARSTHANGAWLMDHPQACKGKVSK